MNKTRPRIDLIRELQRTDEARLLLAFNRANGALDPDFEARGAAHWRWKFFENPAGLRAQVGLDAEHMVLAQYAGLPQRVRLDGEWTHITQGIDSFSDPAARGLGRRGAFVQTGEVFAEQYGGPRGHGDPWMWGLPVAVARRVGERFLGYRGFRAQPLLKLQRSPASGGAAHVERAPLDLFDGERAAFDALNEALQNSGEVHGDRSAQTLRWRYRDHPDREYGLLVQRSDAGELIGYAILTRGRLAGDSGAILCELLCPAGSEGALVNACWREACAMDSRPTLLASLSPRGGAFLRYQALGFRVHGSSLFLVGRSYDRAYPLEFWREKWRMSLGDTDLC